VIQRETQTAAHWQDFTLTQADVDFMHNLMLDAEQPLNTRALALALVTERCRREETELRAGLDRGTLYQPKKRYEIGEKVIFPALDFRLGEVIGARPGENPEYGDFEVITVDFGPDRRQRSFAAGLTAPHKLNVDAADLLIAGDLATPEKLLDTVAGNLPAILSQQLSQQPELAAFENRWLLRDLLAEIHIGHLNIAEAMIEMGGAPMTTAKLLKEVDLSADPRVRGGKPEILAFSLQSALIADGRFDQIGPGETRKWFLRRLEPAEALETPVSLRYQPIPYNRDALPVELLQLEWELDDEWMVPGQTEPASARSTIPSTTLLLTYPHATSGTLPLNNRSRVFFPTGHGERTMVTLIDGRWGQRFPAWVVHQGRYIAGLRAWFEQHKLPAGAFITLARKDNSGEIVVDFRPKRMRREWARWAQVLDDERLDIQLRKQEVACEYDEHVIIGADRADDIIALRSNPIYAGMPLSDLVLQIFIDLAGLSQSGSVHAKTIYSTVNVLRRCPPGPIFEVLATDPRLQSIGDSQYRLII